MKHALTLTAIALTLIVLSTEQSLAQHVSFTRHTIDNQLNAAWDCNIADIDGDGDNDIAAVATQMPIVGGILVWYENDAAGNFTYHLISTTPENPLSIFVIDLDSDNDLDILTSCFTAGEFGWWENDGSQNFGYNQIIANMDNARGIHAVDLDLDGDNDIIIAVEGFNLIAWLENDGLENFTLHQISQTVIDPHFVHAADMDADGDIDILSAHCDGNQIALWDNNGSQTFNQINIINEFDKPWVVYPVNLDNDHDLDILTCARNDDRIGWAENTGELIFINHNIPVTPAIDGPRDICAADFDLDNDLDIACICCNSDVVAFWQNNRNRSFHFWGYYNCLQYPIRVQAGDLDGDTDIDLAIVYLDGDALEWWENTLISLPESKSAAEQNLTSAIQPSNSEFSAFPNPFNAVTTISFNLEYASVALVKVYNQRGELVVDLSQGEMSPGYHQIQWNAGNLSSGLYFIVFDIPGETPQVRKALLLN